jgi:hypothetical protein
MSTGRWELHYNYSAYKLTSQEQSLCRRGAKTNEVKKKMEMAGKDTDAEAIPLLVQHAIVPVYHYIVNPYHSNYGEHVQLLKNFPM